MPEIILHPFANRRRQRTRRQTVMRVKYAGGMVLGTLVTHWAKKLIKLIPGVGAVVSPVLDIIPTALAGPALGAAVVYGLEQGDITAARHKVKSVYRDVSKEVTSAVDDLRWDILEMRRQKAERAKRLLPELEEQIAGMERKLTPSMERYYRDTKRQVSQLKRDLEQSNSSARLKLQQATG